MHADRAAVPLSGPSPASLALVIDLTACLQDDGHTWAAVPVDNWLTSGPWSENEQTFHGIGISSAVGPTPISGRERSSESGRKLNVGPQGVIFLSHGSKKDWPNGLYGQDLFVSRSSNFGESWEASETDFGSALSPGV